MSIMVHPQQQQYYAQQPYPVQYLQSQHPQYDDSLPSSPPLPQNPTIPITNQSQQLLNSTTSSHFHQLSFPP